MDIAAMSTIMAQSNIKQLAGIALTKKVMDIAEVQNTNMIKMMEQSVNPNLGSNIDIKL